MSSDRWRQVEELCHAASTYGDEERRSFLAKACQGDEGLLREVESLLAGIQCRGWTDKTTTTSRKPIIPSRTVTKQDLGEELDHED